MVDLNGPDEPKPLRFEGDFAVVAAQEAVWQALTDPEWLASCVPGLLRYEMVGPDHFAGVASVDLVRGEVRQFPVTVRWYEMMAPATGRLQGQTRIEKTVVEWQALMNLATVEQGTTVAWEAAVTLPDATPQLQRLLRPLLLQLVRRAVTTFLTCVKTRLE